MGPSANEDLLELLYQLPIGVAQTGDDGELVLANPRAMQLLLALSPAAAGTNVFDALGCLEPPLRVQLGAVEARDGTLLDLPRAAVRAADGAERVYALQVRRTAPGRLMTTLDDVTHLAAQERQFAAATRARTDFLASVSHELRTPMNGVLGLANLMLETEVDAEQRSYLELMKGSAEGLLAMVGQVLDFSKIEVGRLSLERVDFDLCDTAARAVTPLGLRAHEKEVDLVCALAPDVPTRLLGDPVRLRQVLVNLASNAIKFTSRGEVLVEVRVVDRTAAEVQLEFSVTDTGCGIPRERQQLIFEPFVQADASVARTHGGTGLGLTISAHLVKLMGGELNVESEPGRGSRFWFRARFPVAASTARVADLAPPDVAGRAVLVVDPHEPSRRMLGELLERWGFRTMLADGRAAAAAALAGPPFAAALVDCQAGYDSMEQVVASLGATPLIPLVRPGRPEARQCRAMGIEGTVLKPVNPEVLARALTAAVQRVSPEPTERPQRLRSLKVLLAEDNAVSGLVTRRVLEREGASVTLARDGSEALRALLQERFDLVLMDVEMPLLDGLQATRALREREADTGVHTRVLAITAHVGESESARCLQAGMDGVLHKPLDLSELDAELLRLRGRRATG
jgi:two-component system sensor histidine kinase/response regulator